MFILNVSITVLLSYKPGVGSFFIFHTVIDNSIVMFHMTYSNVKKWNIEMFLCNVGSVWLVGCFTGVCMLCKCGLVNNFSCFKILQPDLLINQWENSTKLYYTIWFFCKTDILLVTKTHLLIIAINDTHMFTGPLQHIESSLLIALSDKKSTSKKNRTL